MAEAPGASRANPLIRPVARLLVVDEYDRLLLFRAESAGLEVPSVWITPGGGLEPGETHEQAACRELWEETGIVAPLGPWVWTRQHVFHFEDTWYDQHEQFYVVHVRLATVSLENLDEVERGLLTAHRWWTVEEIASSDELFAPHRLAELLRPVLAGAYPDEPIVVGT